MQKQAQPAARKATASQNEGRAFCLLMAFFLIFEVFLTAVVLTRSFSAKPSKLQPPTNTEDTSDTTDTGDEPDALPVFSGGVIPSLPKETADTEEITTLYSQYALLVDADSGEIVAGKGADTRFQPASLTKVMTLIVALEHFSEDDLERKLTVTQAAWDYARDGLYKDASVAGHDVGDELTIRDLLYGIGVESAADCTVMIVNEVAGSESAFVQLMNQKAVALGLTSTHFDNAIGHESESNYTTAREMAAIMAYAMQCELIEDILSVTQHVFQMWGYNSSGAFVEFRFTYYSTLFRSRMETFERYAGEKFSLATSTLTAGKTGSFVTSSYMVCTAKAKSGGREYILVLGDAPKPEGQPASYLTMCDIRAVLDTYVK